MPSLSITFNNWIKQRFCVSRKTPRIVFQLTIFQLVQSRISWTQKDLFRSNSKHLEIGIVEFLQVTRFTVRIIWDAIFFGSQFSISRGWVFFVAGWDIPRKSHLCHDPLLLDFCGSKFWKCKKKWWWFEKMRLHTFLNCIRV